MLRNIFSNWALVLVQIGVLIYQTPIQITALGLTGQGVWLTIASLTSYLVLLTLGLPMASVRFIAAHAARGEVEETNRSIATCLAVSLALSAAALGVSAGLWLFFERTYVSSAWRSFPPGVLAEARLAFWLMAVQVSLNFVAQLPYGILDAHHHFVSRNGVKIAGIVARLGLIVGVLQFHPSLVLLASFQIGAMVLEVALAFLVIRRTWPHLRFGLRGVERSRLREILGFSFFAMLVSLGTQISFQTDQLVINAFGTPDEGTFFDVGNKFFPPLLQLIVGVGAVVMPAATKLQATGALGELRAIYLKWSKITYSMALLVGVYLLLLGPEFLAWWMGPSFALPSGRVTRVIMLSFLLFLPVRGVASPMLMGLGKPVWVSLAFLGMGAVNLALSVWLVKPLGIFGVAVGTAVPCLLFAVAVAFLACREVGVSLGEYLRYVVLRPTLGVIPPALLLYVMKRGTHVFDIHAPRWVEFVPLFFSGVEMVGVFVVVWVLYVYRDDPHVDLAGKLDRFAPRSLRGTTKGRVAVSLTGLGVVFVAGLLAIALREVSPW
jgi:O-antigen/teichoic acid export membrane protein